MECIDRVNACIVMDDALQNKPYVRCRKTPDRHALECLPLGKLVLAKAEHKRDIPPAHMINK